MREEKKYFLVVIAVFCALTCRPVMAQLDTESPFKVASVDVQKVVMSSTQVNNLKADQQKKLLDLQKFVENARADVAKEKNKIKKKVLEDGYNKELNERKNKIDKEYALKLNEIDKNITALIDKKAKDLGYGLVLTKTSVLSGATDITDDILKVIK